MARATVYPLYVETKEFICCNINSNTNALFESWTATGCLAFVLATLCTVEIVRQTRRATKRVGEQGVAQVEAAAEAGDPMAAPPVQEVVSATPKDTSV